MKPNEIAVKFHFLINLFQKNKKRLPFHVDDLKDFFRSTGQPLDFSTLYFLKIRPISREKVRVEYSIRKNPYNYPEYFRESIEITCSIKETNFIPEPELESLLPEFSDVAGAYR